MAAVDKLIFNALLLTGGVAIPDVGTLRTERVSARNDGKRHIRPPYMRVVFSTRIDTELPQLPDLIVQAAHVDSAEAEQIFRRWLLHATHDSTVTIDGVGTIAHNFLQPVETFDATLNPLPLPTVKFLRRRRLWPAFVAVPILILVAVAGYIFCFSPQSVSRLLAPRSVDGSLSSVRESDPSSIDDGSTMVIDSDSTAAEAEAVPDEASAPEPETVPDAIVDGKYLLVVGVFSTDANADKMISQDPVGSGPDAYRKYPFKGGKILVSVFASDDRSVVEKRRRELRAVAPEMWIYRQPD